MLSVCMTAWMCVSYVCALMLASDGFRMVVLRQGPTVVTAAALRCVIAPRWRLAIRQLHMHEASGSPITTSKLR